MKRLLLFASICLSAVSLMAREALRVTRMTTNDEVNPVCVNSVRLGWQMNCPQGGTRQTAYELQVFCDGKTPVLKSGKVQSADQSNIVPQADFQPGKQYTWKVRVWDQDGKPSAWSQLATFGMDINQAWTAQWICTGQPNEAPLPYIRKSFDLKGKRVRRAMVYLCGLGCSQLWMNGQVVDPTRVLDPAQTDYEKRALYSAFDVTKLLATSGRNCLGVMLGKGWYCQDAAWMPGGFSYGTPILRCQLNVEFSDGSTQTIGTDETWRWKEGPVTRCNVYQGEDYDARLAIEGWSKAQLDDSAWNACKVASGVIPVRMEAQEERPMRQIQVVKAKDLWRAPGDGKRWIYDFGVNQTANVQFNVSLPKGTKLTVRGAETLTPQRDMDFRSTGYQFVGYQTDSYICAGTGRETWSPNFTYHGFQYLELTVEGSDAVPDTSWLQAVAVHTDVENRGTFSCSNDQLNALHRIARQTMLNAFVGLPVDCNQREKCGWLGDTHAYDRSANMNFQMNNFWMKYLDDIRTTSDCYLTNTLHHKYINQYFYFTDKTYGIPFMIAPGKRLCGVASPDWGTAVVQLPWHLYLHYGNREILENYYDMMSLWTRHIDSTAVKGIVYEGLGDWCPPKDDHAHNPTRVEFSSTAFHLLDLDIMMRVARLLGKTQDADFFAQRDAYTRQAMIDKFFNPLRNTFGSQTSDAMAIDLNLFPEGKNGNDVASALLFDIQNTRHKFLNMGIFGLSRFGSALSRNGYSKEAMELFTRKGNNSWGMMLDSMHVSTLWESIPYTVQEAWNNIASHCHPMQAGYDVWFYEDVLGIRPSEEAPGYRQIIFAPTEMNELDWAKGSQETAYGHVVSDWHHEGGSIVWNIVIPAGSTGLVTIPTTADVKIQGMNGAQIQQPTKRPDATAATYDFPSGSYEVSWTSL